MSRPFPGEQRCNSFPYGVTGLCAARLTSPTAGPASAREASRTISQQRNAARERGELSPFVWFGGSRWADATCRLSSNASFFRKCLTAREKKSRGGHRAPNRRPYYWTQIENAAAAGPRLLDPLQTGEK